MAGEQHSALATLTPRLVAFARTIVGDPETARDIVQEAAARAIAARRVPHAVREYRAWVFQIVRNAALDELRRRRRTSAAGPVLPDVDLWNFEDARIAKITVEQGLAALDSSHREIIALIDIAGFSYAEAAECLQIPIGTVMSRIARGRQALLGAIQSSRVHPLKSSHGR